MEKRGRARNNYLKITFENIPELMKDINALIQNT